MSENKSTTKLCKYCKSEIAIDAKICPYCRKKQRKGIIRAILLIILGFFLMMVGIVSSVSSPKTSSKAGTVNKDDFINSCSTFDYKEISRNPNDYKNKNCYFRGQIVQVLESGSYCVYRVNVTENKLYSDELMETLSDYIDESSNMSIWEDTIYVTYRSTADEGRFLEDDIVKIYGTIKGLKKYTALLGNEVTIPEINAEYIELDN